MNKLKNCVLCDKVINRPTRPNSKFSVSWFNYKNYRFCSKECRYKNHSLLLSKENHYNWKGGFPKCKDCNKQLKSYNNKRCTKCSYKYYTGKKHWGWKDELINYKYIHQFLYKTYGKPQKCKFCGSLENLEYANIKGNYTKDINDYYSLCIKCHRNYDLKEPKYNKPLL